MDIIETIQGDNVISQTSRPLAEVVSEAETKLANIQAEIDALRDKANNIISRLQSLIS